MELKQWQNIFHVTVNANSMVQYVIQYKNGTIKYVNVNTKIFISAKKIIVGILYLDKAIKPLVLIMPKMNGFVKTFKVKKGGNKLMSLRIDDEKLLEMYKAIWP